MTSADNRAHAGRGHGAILLIVVLGGVVLALFLGARLVYRPFAIPSAAEEPTLYEGDYLIVSKWAYGCGRRTLAVCPETFAGRPFFHAPQRGDVAVFKLPRDGRQDYIKRIVGLPGDRVQLKAGVLYINGVPAPRTSLGSAQGDLPEGYGPVLQFVESPAGARGYHIQKAPDGGQADDTGVYVVPPHCYFTLGDNRDDSLDSRFDPALPVDGGRPATCGWDPALDRFLPPESGVGFVPEQNLIGKAELVLFSLGPRGFRPDRLVLPVS